MNCQELYQHIDDYIADALDMTLAQQARNHFENCVQCRQRLEQRLRLTQSLTAMPTPVLREGFVEQAIARSIDANRSSSSVSPKPANRWAFSAGFASALAASLAVWFFVNLFSVQPDQTPAQVAAVQMLNIELHEAKKVKLLFNSPQALQQATVSLELPGHVEMDGYAGRRSLTWSTDIKAGRNVLSLPIRAVEIGQGELVTTVQFAGKSKTMRFKVNVNQMHQGKPIDEIFLPQFNVGKSA